MTELNNSSIHFSLSCPASESGVSGSVTLLGRVAEHLQDIEGLTDEDILNIVIGSEVNIDGDIELSATVYYAKE